MPESPDRDTVGALIEEGVRVTRSCQWCNDWAEVDLKRIAREKGEGFSMLDRLPLCTNGDCIGMIRFTVYRGCRSAFLMTKKGDARFDQHSDWAFRTHLLSARREAQRRKRSPAS